MQPSIHPAISLSASTLMPASSSLAPAKSLWACSRESCSLSGLGLCGFISGFLLGALEERYLSPRLLLVGAELVQISVHGAVHLAPLSLWIIIFAVHAKETI